MIRPISSVLVDFHRPAAQPSVPSFQFEEIAEAPQDTIDIEEVAREAEERGFERGREAALAEFEEARAAADAAIDEQLQRFGHIIAFRKDHWPFEYKYWQDKGWL